VPTAVEGNSTELAANLARDVLTEGEVAAILKVSIRTLRRWQTLREGPPRKKAGRHIWYHAPAVEAWIKGDDLAGQRPKSRRRGVSAA